jgi:hypothetical protein
MAAALGVALVLSACSGDGDDDAAGTTTEAAAGSTGAAVSTDTGGDDGPDGTDGSSGGASDAEDLDVCALLDDETVAGVLGEPATPTDQSAGPLRGCSWEGTSDALNVLSVSIMVHPDTATAKEQYDATREGLGGVEVTGIGDEASSTDSFGLEVLAGRFDVSVDNTGPDEEQSNLDVARIVLDQLPD